MFDLAVSQREYVDFTPINEDWSVYKLEDNTILKTKAVVIKIVRTDTLNLSVNATNVVGVVPPPELVGTPNLTPVDPKTAESSIEKPDMKFETIHEDWNSYQLADDGTLQLKHLLVEVARTSLHDERGDPVYRVYTQDIMRGVGMHKPTAEVLPK